VVTKTRSLTYKAVFFILTVWAPFLFRDVKECIDGAIAYQAVA
jgi:hypothetical protein